MRVLKYICCFLVVPSVYSFASHYAIQTLQWRTHKQGYNNDGSIVLYSSPFRHCRIHDKSLSLRLKPSDAENSITTSKDEKANFTKAVFFAVIGIAYWYLLVLGSLASASGWPVPEWLPLSPGWPPSTEDLQPVIEDSFHFFYLSELLQNAEAPYVQPLRLSLSNLSEVWVFAFLPVLWADAKRLPKFVLLGLWTILGINLTNAFLAPYLFVTELREPTETSASKNPIVSTIFGLILTAVTTFAIYQITTQATSNDWKDLLQLLSHDRTYLAFAVDLGLFSVFQPLVLSRVKTTEPIDYVPLVGVLSWLFSGKSLTNNKQ